MKKAASIPGDFEAAARPAERTRRPPNEVTEAIDPVCDEIGDSRDEFVSLAASRILQRAEW